MLKDTDKSNRRPVSYLSCIAKTEGSGNPGMTVLEHCLAAGYTASAIASQFPFLDSIGLFPPGYESVAALHDIGKISPSFQLKIAYALNAEDRDGLISQLGLEGCEGNDIHHSTISYSALRDVLGKDIAYIEGSHHGYLRDNRYLVSSTYVEMFLRSFVQSNP